MSKLYKIGDRFVDTDSGDTYILCRVGIDTYNLIELDSGNRWSESLVLYSLDRNSIDEWIDDPDFRLVR